MKILLLGGTHEAVKIAESLILKGYTIEYSLAGVAGQPMLDCPIRCGGFGGWQGLQTYLQANAFSHLIDVTHPYANAISRNASRAAKAQNMPLYRYQRPAWQADNRDRWIEVDNRWEAIKIAIAPYKRPFFSIGRWPLQHREDRPAHQCWLVRTLAPDGIQDAAIHTLNACGPFEHQSERNLLRLLSVDVVVSKNSGGDAVFAKIAAARDLRLPVVLLRRPPLCEQAGLVFEDINDLLGALPG